MGKELGNRQRIQVITSELERGLATDALGPVIISKGGKPVDELKDAQIKAGRLDAVQATHRLVVLIKTADTCTCSAGTSVTNSVALLVLGMRGFSMALINLGK